MATLQIRQPLKGKLHMITYFKSVAVVNSAKTFAYKGNGYRYFLKRSGEGLVARLQISETLLKYFASRVGNCNSLGLPKLLVLKQTSGWWEVTTLNDEDAHVVTKFLARLNKWSLSRATTVKVQPLVSIVQDNSRLKTYQVTVPQIRNRATPQALHRLASKFSTNKVSNHAR